MKILKLLIISVVAIGWVCTSCSSDDSIKKEPEVALENKTMLNVSYGNDTDQVYDIFLPEGRTLNTKVLILVHGGGWKEGDKADMNGFKDFIRAQLPDIVVVNINYRLADENNSPYPMQIDDITSIIKDLKEKQPEYQIGTELGFLGISAGAHLSLLWSYAFDTENKVNMVCSIVGPTNLIDDAYLNSNNEELQNLIDFFSLEEDILEEASPLHRVTANAPPTILFYGGQDPLIPNSQGNDLNDKLEELGVTHEFTFYENEGHGWVGINLFDTSTKLKVFIEAYL